MDKIRARISATLHGYQDDKQEENDNDDVITQGSSVEVCFENINDPKKLYNLLSDVRIRSKYEKRLTVVFVQMENKHVEKERVLQSLDDFFQETKASDMEQFIAELGTVDIDYEEAKVGLENALATATQAVMKLMAIEKEIGQLLALAASYPDTKKGRKKLEKALMKAQEEIQSMSVSLTDMKTELEDSQSKCDHLQTSLDAKTTECVKLRKDAQQVKKLQFTNDTMKAELAKLSSALNKMEEELQKKPHVDEDKVAQLEIALQESQNSYKILQAEKEEQINQLQEEMKNMKTQYETEMAEMKASHEEQLHSLMVDTGDNVSEEEVDGGSTNNSPKRENSQDGEDDAALMSELAKGKNNSRKIIASLKAQLAEAQLKLQTQEETDDLQNQLTELEERNEQTNDRNQQLQLELQTQTIACQKHTARIEELENTLQILSVELQQVSQQQQSADGSPMQSPALQRLSPFLKELITHSTQWSDGVLSRLSPHSLASGSQPLIQMGDIIHSATRFSSPLSNRSVVMDSGSDSIHVSLCNLNTVHGSPLHSGSRATANGEMPGIAMSHLSAFSNSSKPDSIQPNHPIILEWSKAFEQIMRFKGNIVKMLQGSELMQGDSMDEVLQDLQNQENLSLDKERELSGQVTQMRFTLALILHQLETALQSTLTAATSTAKEEEPPQLMDATNQERLLQQIAKFKKQSRLSEETYKYEIQKSKDRIASLCNKMENLKTELSTARKNLIESENIGKSKIVFFTRLDSERNKRALEEAMTSDQISDEEYETIVTDMDDYLLLPGQRLKHIKTQVQQQVGLKKTLAHVRKHSPSPEHTSQVLQMIQQLQEKKRNEFSNKMDKISSKRLELADKLQTDLTKVEKRSGTFLIKPMYPTKYHAPIMIPMRRSLPNCRASTTSAVGKRVLSSRTSQHPAMKLVTELRSELNSRQTKNLPENYGLSTELSSCTPTRPISVDGGTQWSLSSSYAPPVPPTVDFSPVLPRLVELEVSKMRRLMLSPERNRDSLSRSLLRNGTINNQLLQTGPAVNNDGSYGNGGSVLPPIHVPTNLQQQSILTP